MLLFNPLKSHRRLPLKSYTSVQVQKYKEFWRTQKNIEKSFFLILFRRRLRVIVGLARAPDSLGPLAYGGRRSGPAPLITPDDGGRAT